MKIKIIAVTGHPALLDEQISLAKKLTRKEITFVLAEESMDKENYFLVDDCHKRGRFTIQKSFVEKIFTFMSNEFFLVTVLSPKRAWQTKSNHPETTIVSLELASGQDFDPPSKKEKDLFDKAVAGLALFKGSIDYRLPSGFSGLDVQHLVDKILKK